MNWQIPIAACDTCTEVKAFHDAVTNIGGYGVGDQIRQQLVTLNNSVLAQTDFLTENVYPALGAMTFLVALVLGIQFASTVMMIINREVRR